MALASTNKDKTAIRRVFKGQPDAFRVIVEHYQPIVYSVALAQTGHVVLADKAVVATFKEAFERLVSLTDSKRLVFWLCALAHKQAEILSAIRGADKLKQRERDPSAKLVDLGWLQSELIDPLNEEMGPFKIQERKGLLLHVLCGATTRDIAECLKIELKESTEDLARTTENVEKALLKEVATSIQPELNSKERMVFIMREVAGESAAIKASRETRLGRKSRSKIPLLIAAAALVVIGAGGYFAYLAFIAASVVPATTNVTAAIPPPSSEGEPQGGGGKTAAPPTQPTGPTPSNYAIKGRITDVRFGDGVPGLTVTAADQKSETDVYGSFEIKGVPRGEHEVAVYCNDVALLQGQRLSTDKRNPKMEIVLDERVPAPFLLRGRVTDAATGQVLPAFELAAYKGSPAMMPPYIKNEFVGRSSPEGLFTDRFTTLATYTLYVRAQGYAPLPCVFNIKEDWNNDTLHQFPLLRAATIQGKIYGANELTVSEVWIMPRQGVPESIARSEIKYADSDARGEFAIYCLPVGVNWLILDHRTQGTGRAIIKTEPGKVSDVRIQFPKKGSISGDITVNGEPAKFKEFRLASGMVMGSRTVDPQYNSPGQYEVPKLPPGELIISASIEPDANSVWFARIYERVVNVDLAQPNWLDFNYATGNLNISGGLSYRGAPPKTAFIEVAIFRDDSRNAERIFCEFSGATTYQVGNLPISKGEVSVYLSSKVVSRKDFFAARGGMEKKTKPYELMEGANLSLDFSL